MKDATLFFSFPPLCPPFCYSVGSKRAPPQTFLPVCTRRSRTGLPFPSRLTLLHPLCLKVDAALTAEKRSFSLLIACDYFSCFTAYDRERFLRWIRFLRFPTPPSSIYQPLLGMCTILPLPQALLLCLCRDPSCLSGKLTIYPLTL